MTQGKPAPAPADTDQTRVRGIDIAWQSPAGTCTFAKLPVVMMWMDSTLAGVMSGVQAMVGTARFGLAMQSEGRKSVAVGLALVKRIVEIHGGRLWVESDGPGQGSTFCFSLPLEGTSE